MRVAFITLYQYDYGARCLMGYLAQFGHETCLVRVKRGLGQPVPGGDPAALQAILDTGHIPMMEIYPDYVLVCPYPQPLTETEKNLIVEQTRAFQPDFIAFSLTSAHMNMAVEISERLRAQLPGVRQIWGGIHPTFKPEECLRWADAVCVGEGEEALLDYVNAPDRTDIPNIQVKGEGSAVIRNPHRPLVKDLDTLGIPQYFGNEILIDRDRLWKLSDLSALEIVEDLVVSSSRGCPYNCSYCLSGSIRDMYRGQRYRRRKSVDFFLKEIELRARSMSLECGFTIWDDVFTMDEPWIAEFAEKYPARIGLPFGGYCHPRTATRKILTDLKGAGCNFLVMGIQSGSPYIAEDIYNRTLKEEEFIRFGQLLQETGHDRVVYDLITRCPYEREEDLVNTVRLLARLPKPVKIGLKHLAIYPHARIKDLDRPKHNIDDRTYHFYEMLYLLAALPGFDPRTLETLVEDRWLRDHPEVVQQWASQLWHLAQEKESLAASVGVLRRELESAGTRMPWGVKRAGQHFVSQLGSYIRRTFMTF